MKRSKRYLIPLVLIAFTALLIAPLAQTMRTANTTNDLVLLSPYTINTNTYVVTEGTIGDGTATWWTFVAGDVTGPDATHLQPLLYPTAGRWVKNTGGSGGTNIFNTIYATNIYGTYNYFSNIYVTNLFVTNIFNRGGAKPMIKLGDTNIYITNTYVTINGTNLAVVNPTTPYVPYRNSDTNFLDSAWYMVGGTNIGIDSQVIFGPGATNKLARSGTTLEYTVNDAASTTLAVVNTNSRTRMTISGDGASAALQGGTGTAQFGLLSGADGILVGSGYVIPTGAGKKLGSGGTPWGDFNWNSTNYGWGFYDGVDHSRLAIFHGGTNDAIHFDSQSSGTAGDPVPLDFDFGGTNAFKVLPYRAQINASQNNNPTLLLRQNMTNTSSQGQIVFEASDTDGIGDLAVISSYEDGGWDVGVPGGRAGGLSLQSQYNNSLNTRLDIKGSSGLIQFWNRDHSGTNMEIANVSGYTGTGAKIFTDDGTFKSGGALTNAANWVASGATDSTLAGTASVDRLIIQTNNPLVSIYPFVDKTRLVFAGDSITAGTLLPAGANWPSYLTNTFITVNVSGATNTATSGYGTAAMAADYAAYVAPFKPDGVTNAILFVLCGVNDIALSTNQIHDNLSNYWSTAKADGFTVVAMTITKANSISSDNNAKMESVNALIRQSRVWDYLVDTANLITTTYGTTIDGVHWSTNYHGVVARSVAQTLSTPITRDSQLAYFPAGSGSYLNFYGHNREYVNHEMEPGIEWRAYRTYTSEAVNEYFRILWSGTSVYLQSSGGAQRNILIDGSDLTFDTAHTGRFNLDASGDFVPFLYNTYSIGKSGSALKSLHVATSIQSGITNVLVSTTSKDFFYVSVPNTNGIGGHVVYTVFATDGTDVQELSGDCKFSAVAKGTTVTATRDDVQGTAALTGGSTLTAALAVNTATNNVFALGVTATTSLTTTNLVIKWRVETPSTFTINAIP